ncbi:Leucine-rich repeat-containing protein 1 [Hondaea fermentalgiana]|uniref:Leucine-rich repeat-containing protein 1 n=1 Tax=Hondaea fermentalgiana TaxID=2315210 RepID=A0A2R5GQB0_9STRA|nr:Leucine-rich repeat-containing protein 1 [Hondaea fermentalgiana]|eukprot:GBG30813.1 Leucine-rich repeat-containing protein 1 [Hondaea fermentalgiana]
MGVLYKLLAVAAPLALTLEVTDAACTTVSSSLTCTDITSYPDIADPSAIETLYVVGASITSSSGFEDLPTSISLLTNLKSLYVIISETALEAIPDEVSALTSLTQLNVPSNAISYLPESLGTLSALQILTAMQALASISAQNNEIETIPSVISDLEALTYLNLANNPLCGDISATENVSTLVLPDEVGECDDGLSMAVIIAIPLAFVALAVCCLGCLWHHKYRGAGKNRTGNSAGQHQLW